MLALTARQRQCLLLRSRGMTNKEVARALDCSDKTVEHQHRMMMSKNPEYTPWSLLAEFVREQCREGVWE